MDIQARKIEFIQQFLKLQNENSITRLENALIQETREQHEENLEPMSVEDLSNRIDQSMDDSENDRVYSMDQLKSTISEWK
jgi:hypothetical protein